MIPVNGIKRHDQLCVCVFTDRPTYGHIIIPIVYTEPNVQFLSDFFFKTRTAKFINAQLWFTMTRNLLVLLRHIIRTCLVRLRKPCMNGSLYGIFVFLREVNTRMLYIQIIFCIMKIQVGCFEISFRVFILTGITLCI